MKTQSFFKTFLLAIGLIMTSGMWGATQFCETPSGHLGNADFGDRNACVKLTITQSSEEGFVDVTVAMNRDLSTTSKIDYIYVLYKGLPYTAGTDDNGDALDELTAHVNVGDDVAGNLMIQYSNPNWGGRWQIDLTDVDFTASCSAGGEQGGGEPGEEPEPEPEPEPSAIDWSSIGWVAASNNKFKVGATNDVNLPNVVEVQQPGWAAKRGIYLTFPAAEITCSYNHAIQGAGMILYTDQFFAKETEVTVNYAGGSKTFVVYYEDGIDFSAPAPVASEYCNYYGPQTRQDGKFCSITWITNNAGDVVITLSDGPADATGYTGVSFRGDCFEGDFDKFKVVSAANGIENASKYFTRERSAAENYYILRKNATALPEGQIVIKTDATLAWTSNENASRWQNEGLVFSYTYGTTCPTLETPTNVVVANDGTITFDAVDGAEKYVAHVFNGAQEVYSGEVTNSGVIDYLVYVATTLTVKLEAVTGGMSSEFSDAATWNAAASPLPASVWCETAGVATAKNNWGDAHFTINTLPNGNVTIVVSSPNGTAAHFRNSKGMNGTFKLDGHNSTFNTYFTGSKTSDDTFTLALVDPANRPTIGSIIDYSGQIECATSQNVDDWSNYDILGYVYGTTCPTDVPVTGVTLNQTTASVPVNKTLTLVATVAPNNAANKTIIWTSSNDAIATVADGVVTPQAVGGPVTITARTEDGDFTATCAVTVTAAKVTEPDALPVAPTYAAAKVRAIHSATYSVEANYGNWGGSQSFTKEAYGIKIVMNPGNGYCGLVDFPAINANTMEYLHADVWIEDDASLRFVPIVTGQGEHGVTANLTGGQWNAIDLALDAASFANYNDWTNVFQLKIDQAAGLTFWINNVYFYTTSEDDVTKPVMTSASLESVSYMSAIINVAATDDRGVAKYVVKNGATEMGKYTPAAGKITVTGLTDATAYTLSVYAEDAAENVSDNKVDVELTTLALPAATAPNVAGKEYRSVYAPSLTNMLKHDFALANWGSAAGTKVDAKGYTFYHTTNNATVVWGENNAGGNAIVAADAYKGSKGGLDASEMEYMHVDIWADKAGCNSLIIVINDHNLGAAQTLNAGWNSLDIALSEFAVAPDNNYLLDNVAWIKFVGLNNTNDVAVTNVYFWKEIPAATYPFTTTDTDFYTFYADEELSIPEGMTVYTGAFDGSTLTITEIETGIIPARTGVLVKTETAGTYVFEGTTTNAPAIEGNSLRGVAVETPCASIKGANEDIYVVGEKDGVVGFYRTTRNIPAHRAYLSVSTALSGAPVRIVMQTDMATDVENIATDNNGVKFIENGKLYIRIADRVYDATGRLVK